MIPNAAPAPRPANTPFPNAEILDEVLTTSTQAIFGHYGLELEAMGLSVARQLATQDAIGVIGFTGEAMRGTLVIATSVHVVAQTCPTGEDTASASDRVRDWLGELCNLILGRVKIALLSREVTIQLSTPVAFTAQQIRLAASCADRARAWDLNSSAGLVRVWIEAQQDAGLLIGSARASELDAGFIDGEPLLF